MKKFLVTLVSLSLCFCSTIGWAAKAATPKKAVAPKKAVTSTTIIEQKILTLVNIERKKYKLKPLQLLKGATITAQQKANDLAKYNMFSHTSKTYGSAFQHLKKNGVSYKSAGENIASGQTTTTEVMKGWMNSPGHKANILRSSFTHLGVGFKNAGKCGTTWVQVFVGK